MGHPVPAIRDRPTLDPALGWIWDAFGVLDQARGNNGFSLQPIALQEIRAYAELVGLEDLESRETLIRHVQAMDRQYLLHHRGKTAPKGK